MPRPGAGTQSCLGMYTSLLLNLYIQKFSLEEQHLLIKMRCSIVWFACGLPCSLIRAFTALTDALDNTECMNGDTTECMNGGRYFAHAHNDLNLSMFEDTFLA